MRIAIDVDLTTCAIDVLWWKWLQSVTDSDKLLPDIPNLEYNLSHYFTKELENAGINGLDFFRKEGVYDYAKPVRYAKLMIKDLHSRGHEIIFVSAIKGNHHKSKYHFLQRHFPYMDGFVATKEKQYVNCDVIVDDRNEFLNKAECKHKIFFKTNYKQYTSLDLKEDDEFYIAKDWLHVHQIITRGIEM